MMRSMSTSVRSEVGTGSQVIGVESWIGVGIGIAVTLGTSTRYADVDIEIESGCKC